MDHYYSCWNVPHPLQETCPRNLVLHDIVQLQGSLCLKRQITYSAQDGPLSILYIYHVIIGTFTIYGHLQPASRFVLCWIPSRLGAITPGHDIMVFHDIIASRKIS